MPKAVTKEKRSEKKTLLVLPPQFKQLHKKAVTLLNDPAFFNQVQNNYSASITQKPSAYGRIAAISRAIITFADANSCRNQIMALNTIAGEIGAQQRLSTSEPIEPLLEDAIQIAIQTLIFVAFHCSDQDDLSGISVNATALRALVKCVPNDVTFINEIGEIKLKLRGKNLWIKHQFKSEITSWLKKFESNYNTFELDENRILDMTKKLDEGSTGEPYDWGNIRMLGILNSLFSYPEIESIFLDSIYFVESLLHLAIYTVQCYLDKSLLQHVTTACGDELCEMALKLSQNVMIWLIDNHHRLNNGPSMCTIFYALGVLCEIHYRKNNFASAKNIMVGITIINTLLYPCLSSNLKCEMLIRNNILDTSRWNEPHSGWLNSLSYFKLLEAVIITPVASNAMHLLLKDTSDTSLFDLFLNFARNSAHVYIRHLAVESVLAILKKLDVISVSRREKLLDLTMTRLEEPSTGVGSQIQGIIDALFASDRMAMRGLSEKKLAENFWRDFVTDLLKSDWNRRGKYPPLNALLKNFGAIPMLDIEPDLQNLAIKAQATMSHMGRSPADFLRQFWTCLWIELQSDKSSLYTLKHLIIQEIDANEKTIDKVFFEATIPSLIQGLRMDYTHGESERVSEYIIPTYLKVQKNVSFAVDKLLQHMQVLKLEDQLCCIPITLAMARATGKFVVVFSDDLCLLLSQALDCHLTIARIGVIQLLGNHIAQTEPIDVKELILFLKALQIFLCPDLSPTEKSKFRNASKKFLIRIAESLNSAKSEGSWWTRLAKSTMNRDEVNRSREGYIEMCQTYLSKICRSLICILTPGVSSHRRSSCIEILSIILSEIDFSLILSLDSSFDARIIFETLVVCLMDSIDQTRVLVNTILTRFPFEKLKGSDAVVLRYFKFALVNLETSKYRESDSAASILRLIFLRYVQGFGWNLKEYFLTPDEQNRDDYDNNTVRTIEPCDATLSYLEASLELLRCKNKKGKVNIMEACENGFVQGICLMLNYVLQDCNFIELMNYSTKRSGSFMEVLLDVLSESVEIAIQGVAFHEPNINAYVFIEDDSDLMEFNDERQKFVTSCFLSVKEICHCLSILTEKAIANESYDILNLGQVNRVISIFEHVLCNTRHTGVIDRASTMYQRIAAKLLTCRNHTWQLLPQKRLESVLAKALEGDLYVLRRSAGLTFFAIATFRANHSKSSNPLLKHFIEKLIHKVIVGLDDEQSMGVNTEVRSLAVDRNLISISHSLNILRSVFQDSDLAESSSPYVGNGFECAVKAFRSESWLIRNSATLLFAALVKRGVGPLLERSGKYVPNGCTADRFFSTYPGIEHFLILDLKRSISGHGVISCQPSLVPILSLLATFYPALITVTNPSEGMTELLHLVMSCLQSSDDGIRRFASSAAFALMGREQMVSWCIRVAKDLPYQQGLRQRSKTCVGHQVETEIFYTFQWDEGGSQVYLVGSFDDFGSQVQMFESSEKLLQKQVAIVVKDKHVQFKFLVDGEWKLSKSYAKEIDSGGTEVNYVDVTDTSLALPNLRDEVRHNYVNGLLELLVKVLQNSLELDLVHQKREFYAAISEELLPKSWLMSGVNKCFVIQGTFFNAISLLMKHISRTDLLTPRRNLPPKFEELINIAANYASQAIKNSTPNKSFGAIGRDVMLGYASSVLFLDFELNFQASNSSDMSYIDSEVLTCIDKGEAVGSSLLFSLWKFLGKNLSLIEDTQENMNEYLRIVEKIANLVLVQEKIGDSTVYALQCLIELFSKKKLVFSGIDKLMEKTLEFVETCKVLDLSETALEFYGICMHRLSESKSLKSTVIRSWLILLFEWSDESKVASSREAACRSLGKSGILCERTEYDSEDTVYGWLLAARLIQDDDSKIRAMACEWSKCVNENIQADVIKTLMNVYSHLIESYPESELLVEFFSRFSIQNAICGDIFSYLYGKLQNADERCVCRSILVENVPKASAMQQRVNSISKMYSTERDNFYFESSLETQLVGYSSMKYMLKMLQRISRSDIEMTETLWELIKLSLQDALSKLDELTGGDILIESAFNNELVYNHIYSHLMNVYVLSAAAQYLDMDFSNEAKRLLSKGRGLQNIHPSILILLSNIVDAYALGSVKVPSNESIVIINPNVFTMLY